MDPYRGGLPHHVFDLAAHEQRRLDAEQRSVYRLLVDAGVFDA